MVGNGNDCFPTTDPCGDGSAATDSALYNPSSVAVDDAGNLYIADTFDNRVRKVTASAAPLAFPNTAIGMPSATQTVTVNNIGNTALSLSPYFTQSNSSTCPLVYSSSSAQTLAPGAACTEVLSYTPTIAGAVTGNLIFTDNSLDATSATQTIVMTGTTPNAGLTMQAVGQNVPQGTASITLEFTVGYGGQAKPTGTPTLTVAGSTTGLGTIACNSKAGHNNCTATYNTSTLAAGTYTITATQSGDANYSSTSATALLTVTGSGSSHVSGPVVASPITVRTPGGSSTVSALQPTDDTGASTPLLLVPVVPVRLTVVFPATVLAQSANGSSPEDTRTLDGSSGEGGATESRSARPQL